MKESDLYLPLKRFLESQNYEVKGEVQDCDVVAVRGEEAPVVVELKLISIPRRYFPITRLILLGAACMTKLRFNGDPHFEHLLLLRC